jgi:hypothetical protein
MRVVDTSAWIEWLIGGPHKKVLAKEIPAQAQCIVHSAHHRAIGVGKMAGTRSG